MLNGVKGIGEVFNEEFDIKWIEGESRIELFNFQCDDLYFSLEGILSVRCGALL